MKRSVWSLALATVLMMIIVNTLAQGTRLVTLSLGLPNGGHPLVTVEEGGLATIQLPDVGTFGFRPTMRDSSAGTLTVAIFSGATVDSPLLTEVDVTVGAPPVQSGTKPSFAIAITRVEQK